MLQRVAISLLILMTIILSLQLLPAAADGTDDAPPPADCPKISIISDQILGNQGQFSASVWTNALLTYQWVVTGGSIISGGNEATMVAQLSPIAAKKAKAEKKTPILNVSLTLEGLPEGCPATMTRDLEISPPLGE